MVKKRGKKADTGNLKLNAVKFGLSAGIVLALCVFLINSFGNVFPIWDAIILDAYAGVGILRTIYLYLIGISPILWSLLAGLYGFIDGFVIAWLFASVYNRLLK